MQEKLDLLRKNIFIELASRSGLGPNRGKSGLIITEDRKLYYYNSYNSLPEELKDEIEKEYISDGEEIPEETYQKIQKYLNENIIGKNFEPMHMRDSSCTVRGKDFNVSNYYDIYKELSDIIKSEKNMNE